MRSDEEIARESRQRWHKHTVGPAEAGDVALVRAGMAEALRWVKHLQETKGVYCVTDIDAKLAELEG